MKNKRILRKTLLGVIFGSHPIRLHGERGGFAIYKATMGCSECLTSLFRICVAYLSLCLYCSSKLQWNYEMLSKQISNAPGVAKDIIISQNIYKTIYRRSTEKNMGFFWLFFCMGLIWNSQNELRQTRWGQEHNLAWLQIQIRTWPV